MKELRIAIRRRGRDVAALRRGARVVLAWLFLLLPFAAVAQPRGSATHREWLGSPGNASYEAYYDPTNGTYVVYEKIGERILGRPRVVTAEEFRALQREEQMRTYWRSQRGGADGPAGGRADVR